jgi:hypothetical protein
MRDVLATRTWFKSSFQRDVETLFRDHLNMLAGIALVDNTKRESVDIIIERLQASENLCPEFIIDLLLELADTREEGLTDYDRLDRRDSKDAAIRRADAERAISRLRNLVEPYRQAVRLREELAKEQAAQEEQHQERRSFEQGHQELRDEFDRLATMTDRQQAGIELEKLIVNLANLYDLDARTAYSLKGEQIDGAFTFNKDGYIIEAKWWAEQIGRAQGDVFAAKVRRKGRNTLGLFVSMQGFTRGFRECFAVASPFITMDAIELLAILEQRLRFDDVLRDKKRHLDESGSCHWSVV